MERTPLRILYISHLHPPEGEALKNLGGMQRVSMQLTRALKQREDVELDTIILQASWKGIGIKTAGFLGQLIAKLPNRAKSFNADLILFSSMVTASVSLLTRNRVSIPMVTIAHGQDVTLPSRIYQWLVPKIFRRLDGIIAVSRATRQACIKRGFPANDVRALANGFDEKDRDIYPAYPEARRQIADAWSLDLDHDYLLLTVGRLVKRKGHERFIRRILPSLEVPVNYLIIGDGPQKKAIHKAIKETGQADCVTLAGRQPDAMLRKAYAAADLFIMPNIPVEGDMEGFGIVLLEANLAETPAIASDLEGIKDVITNGHNGYRVEIGDDKAFCDKIEEVLLKENLRAQGRKARSHVLDRFSWDRVAGQYVEFVQEIVKRTKIT